MFFGHLKAILAHFDPYSEFYVKLIYDYIKFYDMGTRALRDTGAKAHLTSF